MSRRVSLVVFLSLASALVLVTGLTAGVAQEESGSKRSELDIARERLVEVQQEAAAAQNAYNNALFELNELDKKIAETEAGLERAEEDLKKAQNDLEDRASQVYKSGNVGFMDVLVGVEDFSNFSSRVDLWLDLLAQERFEFDRVRQAKTIDAVIARKDAAVEAEEEAEKYLNSLSEDLRASNCMLQTLLSVMQWRVSL